MIKMFAYLKKYYKGVIFTIIIYLSITVITSLIRIKVPLIAQNVLNRWDVNVPDKEEILVTVFILLIFLITRIVLDVTNTYVGRFLSADISLRMRMDALKHIQRLPLVSFDNKRTGSLISRTVSDVESISSILYQLPNSLLSACLLFGGSLLAMLRIDQELTLVLIMIIPVFLIINLSLGPLSRKYQRESRTQYGYMISIAENSYSGIRVTKSFNEYSYMEDKFYNAGIKYKKLAKKQGLLHGFFWSSFTILREGFRIIIIAYGGYKLSIGEISIGDLVAFQLFMFAFMRPLNTIISIYPQILTALGSFDKYYEIMVLQEEPNLKKPLELEGKNDLKPLIYLEKLGGDIKLKGLSFSYSNISEKEVLQNIDINIEKGMNIGLVGETGSGKSTICSLLLRLYNVEKDMIYIDDYDINKLSLNTLRDNIGIVQQDIFLFAGTVLDNLLVAKPTADIEEIINACRFSDAHEFITELPNQYDTYIGERGVMLSGGQKQRIAIARLFLKDPNIILLDEATSALDNQTEKVIQKTLNKLAENKTTITIAHRLTTVKECDKIFVIDKGEIIEAGNHIELMDNNGKYKELYEADISSKALFK